MSRIIRLAQRCPETALDNLNRLTGLDFQSWPESLLDIGEDVAADNLEAPSEREGGTAPERAVGHGR